MSCTSTRYEPSGYEYDTTGSALFAHDVVMGVCNSNEEERIVAYCMEIGLLPSQMLCPKCCERMKLAYRRASNSHGWRCQKRSCDKYLSVRAGTVFSYSKLPLGKLVMLLFYFATEAKSTTVRQYLKVTASTMADWFDICRGYCSKEMMRIDMKVGGPGHVVEIDETSLAKKQKYHRGKKYAEFWLFGGYDRTSKKWFATITFDDRTKETLTSVIAEIILPHTHIISDMFASYVLWVSFKMSGIDSEIVPAKPFLKPFPSIDSKDMQYERLLSL